MEHGGLPSVLMWLPWDKALVLAALLGVLVLALRGTDRRWAVTSAAVAREAFLLAIIYAAWNWVGEVSTPEAHGALERGVWIWDFERAIRLPSEAWLQDMILPHRGIVQFANVYYATAHIGAMGIFLVWLVTWHRDRFPHWRNALALVTAIGVLIQMIAVAPPRLVPSTHMVDTGLAYGQSVYQALGRGEAGQLQAMPSLHVAWAVLIAVAVWELAPSPWRWIGPLHAATTMWVVMVTANHYWLDGIVGAAIVVVVLVGQRLGSHWWARRADARSDLVAPGPIGDRGSTPVPAPVAAPSSGAGAVV